ncbi:hydrolase [Mesobacillus campisalis]|uniref:Hydrolase n=1 Tax=Mesobacillus campisalis TaxID=1408103 RepID=A0A0M2SUC7_9BACI|nr:hypothetical protein [Mesobacillus campisalis]KKK36220.1 hydrolase [Mesobacillus campisalis]
MAESRKTYYIDVASGEISQSRTASTWNFQIQANDEEITRLREEFDCSHSSGVENFLRAHVPFLEYHHDRQNDEQDASLKRIYAMIHQLGDQEAKKHIESMGILPSK